MIRVIMILDLRKECFMTNAIEKELMKDHRKIKTLMNQIEKALDKKSKADKDGLFQELKEELVAHSKAEDKAFYERLVENEKTKDIVNEAKEEHAIVETLLKQISTLDSESDEWKAKFTVLKELVEHHVEDEEGEMFPKSEKVIDEEEGEEIKEEFLQKKEKISAKF